MPKEATTDEVDPEVGETEELEAPSPTLELPEDFASRAATEWGYTDPAELERAAQVYRGLQTEDGVVDMFIETARSMGFGVKEIEKFLSGEEAVPAAVTQAVADEVDPDQPITLQDLDRIIAERVDQPLAQTRQEQAVVSAQQSISSFFQTQQIDEKDQKFIRSLARDYLPDNDFNPTHIQAALERGLADFKSVQNGEMREVLKDKVRQGAKIPSKIGGSTDGGDSEDDETPKYGELGRGALEAAKLRVRAKLAASE